MYAEWSSLQELIRTDTSNLSVLNSFPTAVGKEVACSVVKHLAQNLTINNSSCEESSLKNDKEVSWSMEVICYGLSLPLSEHDTIRDCVNVYCEWMTALTSPKICVPKPIVEDPNTYVRKMIQHLYNLFVPREDTAKDVTNKQAVLCHRVLRTIQAVARESSLTIRETWETLLQFLLAINDTLLAPPTVKDIGDQLGERVMSVLFEMWLLACSRCFPSPPLWKTFRDMCLNWRHNSALIEQWNRVNFALTSSLLTIIYGKNYPKLKIPDDDKLLVPTDMDADCTAQSWFRFLHILSNPVDLCRPTVISQTPKFLHFAITSEIVIDPCQHPCLISLPQIFHKSMRGLAVLVDAFLGIAQPVDDETVLLTRQSIPLPQPTTTPPTQRKKPFSVTSNKGLPKPSLISLTTIKQQQQEKQQEREKQHSFHAYIPAPPSHSTYIRHSLATSRPKCNSILHLFGAWMFEATLAGSKLPNSDNTTLSQLENESRRSGSLIMEPNKRRSGTSEAFSPIDLTKEDFEAGQAEALGALCRIICAKKTEEDILPVYLARFYIAMHQGLQVKETISGHLLASIIINSCDLLRLDLDGVQVLIPHLLTALELILPDRDPKFKSDPQIPYVELRRASIQLLLSMLCLPLHFNALAIKDIFNCSDQSHVTFQSLKPKLVNLLISALQYETDSTNTQMLLGGLMLCTQDTANYEEVEQITLQQTIDYLGSVESTVNLLTSECESNSASVGSLNEVADNDLFINSSAQPVRETDSAHALFVRAIYLVCHRLISTWKTDLNVSLAALELLGGMAKIKLRDQDFMECKRAVKWICDYIVYQCNRPPPAHSKDLHSTIVAAYHCLISWLVEHHKLLQDKECLHIVLEVVELGISGSKSQPKVQNPPKLKQDKELKPASMRVRDAAESVMAIILEQVGAFPPPCGPESLSTLLDEDQLLKYAKGNSTAEGGPHFRYFVLDNSVILGLLEQPLGNDQDPLPTVTALIRGPFGRNAWTLQLRHISRQKSGSKAHLISPRRPAPINDLGTKYNVKPKYFPDSVEGIPQCKADHSIPSLEQVILETSPSEHEKMSKLIENQIKFEEGVKRLTNARQITAEYSNRGTTECKQPSVCHEFQTARLFLNHLGLLSLDALKESVDMPIPKLVALDSTHLTFKTDIDTLDTIPNRVCDTVFVFYVKSGQNGAQEILNNVTSKNNVHPHFLEFLRSLGWPVDVFKHAGWTGHVNTSWKVTSEENIQAAPIPKDTGGSLYDGSHQVLYWSDVTTEVAFVVPSKKISPPAASESLNLEVPVSQASKEGIEKTLSAPPDSGQRTSQLSSSPKPRTLSLDLERPPKSWEKDNSPGDTGRTRRFGRFSNTVIVSETKVLVVWLESFEDHLTFPHGDLVYETSTGLETSNPMGSTLRSFEKDVFIIFIHVLQSGLFRIHMLGQTGKISMATPLVDGMVVSRRVLGTLIRQTAVNMCRRKRLENEVYQPPYIRRKLKIQDIVNKHRCRLSEPEFYTSLFV